MCTASGMDKLIAEVHARLESIPMGTFVSKLYPPESPIALPAHLPSLSESDEVRGQTYIISDSPFAL